METLPVPYGMERIPPQSVATEQAVLSAMLMDMRAIDSARELLKAEDFYHGPHRMIFAAILRLADDHEDIDQISVAEDLKRHGKLDAAGGIVYVSQIASELATWANIRTHSRIVADKACLRRIIEMTHKLQEQAYSDTEEAETLIRTLEAQVNDLQGAADEGGLVPYEEILSATLERMEVLSARGGKLTGIPTGFDHLDRMTGGFQPGDLILLAGRPKMGKSALGLMFANAAATAGHLTAYFSMEMSASSLATRHLAMEASIDAMRVRTGDLGEDEWMGVARASARLANLPLCVDDRPGLNVLQIGSACRKLKRARDLKLVIVDYLQLMSSHLRTNSREQEVSKMSLGLKNLARELDVPLIAIAQLSRKVEDRPNKKPIPSDLRDSGSLEQDCDVCMFIYRAEEYGHQTMRIKVGDGHREISTEGMAEINVAMHRNGPTGTVYARWQSEYTRFTPYHIDTFHADPPELFVTHHNNE